MQVVCNYRDLSNRYYAQRLHHPHQQGVYYMTFTIVGWIDVFSRKQYRDIFIDSLKYCQKNKGLHLHAYVIMSNHVHLIVSVDQGCSISDFVRDCKKFTSKEIIKSIENDQIESRKDWMLHQFRYFASRHSRNEIYQLWQQDNHFVELMSSAFTQQKLDYIHNNPVRAGWVYKPEDFIYSSASNYAGIDKIIEVDCLRLI